MYKFFKSEINFRIASLRRLDVNNTENPQNLHEEMTQLENLPRLKYEAE